MLLSLTGITACQKDDVPSADEPQPTRTASSNGEAADSLSINTQGEDWGDDRTITFGFILIALFMMSLPIKADHSWQLITVTQDSAIAWSDADGCYNYIEQTRADGSKVWRRANGNMLRAGRTFLHTTYNSSIPADSITLDALLQQEMASTRSDLQQHLPEVVLALVGAGALLGAWKLMGRNARGKK